MFYYFDPLQWVVLGIGLLLSLGATAVVKGTFAHYSRVRSRRGITGAQVAAAILQANGITDVRIERVGGHLSDHYDPSTRTLRLSEPVYGSDSVAAIGVAAHEVGHAIQHAHGYLPLKFRSAWVPVAGFGTQIGIWIVFIAAMLGGIHGAPVLTWIGLGLFAAATVMTLVTLPVEFDASWRALGTLRQTGVLTAEEMPGARRVLTAAALTYVAAFIASLLQLLYWAYRLGLFGRRDD